MELIIVLVIFALSAAICMRTFAESKLASELANDLSNALIKVESAAECWRGEGGDAVKTAELLSLGVSGDSCFGSFDKQWQPCSQSDAAYSLTLESTGGQAHIEATRLADDKLLYSLDVKLPGGAAQ
jgi:type II secretory pathway pseudopilin PulG